MIRSYPTQDYFKGQWVNCLFVLADTKEEMENKISNIKNGKIKYVIQRLEPYTSIEGKRLFSFKIRNYDGKFNG